MLDILVYLFENYMDNDTQPYPEQTVLLQELIDVGFNRNTISDAFHWLDSITQDTPTQPVSHALYAIRHYDPKEIAHIDCESRGYLLTLEQHGILTQSTRELAINQLMALPHPVTVEHLKWVILIILFNQPDQQNLSLWMEEHIMMEDASQSIH